MTRRNRPHNVDDLRKYDWEAIDPREYAEVEIVPPKHLTEWESDGIHNDWIMPAAPKWKRLPIIRHVRAINEYLFVRRLERAGNRTFSQDRWIALGIWLGEERDQ